MKGDLRGKMIFILGLFFVLFLFLFWIRQRRILKYEKRFQSFSLQSFKEEESSLWDRLISIWKSLVHLESQILKKSAFWVQYSKRFTTYQVLQKDAIDLLSTKILMAIGLSLLYVLTPLFSVSLLGFLGLLFAFCLGFWGAERVRKKTLRKMQVHMQIEFEKMIKNINRSFKTGKNLYQAIECNLSEETRIEKEFALLAKDLSYGLDLEKSFSRFYERTQLEDVLSLVLAFHILKKTGGSPRKAFDWFEKTVEQKGKINQLYEKLSFFTKLISSFLLFFFLFMVFLFWRIYPSIFERICLSTKGYVLGLVILLGTLFYFALINHLKKGELK